MELDKIKLAVIGLMLFSMAAIIYWGIGGNEKALTLILFSASIGFAALFFDDWTEREE